MQLTPAGYEGIGALNWLAFNLTKKPLSDVKVRKAIAHTLDKNFISKALMAGFAKPADGPIVASSPFAVNDLVRYPVDLKKAVELLDAAGYKAGANGERFKLSIDYLPGADDQQKTVAEYIRTQLKKVGIAVEVRTSADFPAWAKRMATKDFDMSMDSVFNWGDPVIGVHRLYQMERDGKLEGFVLEANSGEPAQHRRRPARPGQAQGLLRHVPEGGDRRAADRLHQPDPVPHGGEQEARQRADLDLGPDVALR